MRIDNLSEIILYAVAKTYIKNGGNLHKTAEYFGCKQTKIKKMLIEELPKVFPKLYEQVDNIRESQPLRGRPAKPPKDPYIVATYYVAKQSTFRKTAKVFGCSMSTVQHMLTRQLPKQDPELYQSVKEIIRKNQERAKFKQKNISE